MCEIWVNHCYIGSKVFTFPNVWFNNSWIFSIFELFSASPLCVVLAASWFCTLTKVGVLWWFWQNINIRNELLKSYTSYLQGLCCSPTAIFSLPRRVQNSRSEKREKVWSVFAHRGARWTALRVEMKFASSERVLHRGLNHLVEVDFASRVRRNRRLRSVVGVVHHWAFA